MTALDCSPIAIAPVVVAGCVVASESFPGCAVPAPAVAPGRAVFVKAEDLRRGWVVVSHRGFDWTIDQVLATPIGVELRSVGGDRFWRVPLGTWFEVRRETADRGGDD